jgi:hypothetical protein
MRSVKKTNPLQHIQNALLKRRKIGFIVLFIIAILGYFIDQYYPFLPPEYISPEWRDPFVYFLITYKVIELGIFYLLFYKRYSIALIEAKFHLHAVAKFEKNAKRFFFLVPQGSIVFGFLSYKLTGEIMYLWLFLCISTLALWLVNPKKLKH